MAKTFNSNTPYRIVPHVTRTRTYASLRIRVEQEGKAPYYKRHYVGRVEDNTIFPNQNYYELSEKERKKLILPEGWSILETDTTSMGQEDKNPVYHGKASDKSYGGTFFLNNIVDTIGLQEMLMSVFNGNKEIVAQILSLAYAPIFFDFTYSHLYRAQRLYKLPWDEPLTPTDITRITQHITEDHRVRLFKEIAKRQELAQTVALDSTSITTFGVRLLDIRMGHNKEKLPFPQTMLLVVYSISNNMPIYYRRLPGNTIDSRSLKLALKDLELMGYTKVILILDRGYDSAKNLGSYVKEGNMVVYGVKIGNVEVKQPLEELQNCSGGHIMCMEYDPAHKLYYRQFDVKRYYTDEAGKRKKTNVYLNLYYDPFKAEIERHTIYKDRDDDESELRSLILSCKCFKEKERKTLENKFQFHTLEFEEDGRLADYKEKEDFTDKIKKCGYFASETVNVRINPIISLGIYGSRDHVEKYFSGDKSELGHRRMRAYTEESVRGRTFINFLSMIIFSYLRHMMSCDNNLRRMFSSTTEIVRDFENIRLIERDGERPYMTEFIGSQVETCEIFGIAIPDGCAPSGYKPEKYKVPTIPNYTAHIQTSDAVKNN